MGFETTEEAEPGVLSRLRSLLPSRGVTVPVEPIDAAAGMLLGGLEVARKGGMTAASAIHMNIFYSDTVLAPDVPGTVPMLWGLGWALAALAGLYALGMRRQPPTGPNHARKP